MDSCEVIYLSKLAQRAREQGKQPLSALPPEPERAKVVDLQEWAAEHRPCDS